jgi:hypothetical protein
MNCKSGFTKPDYNELMFFRRANVQVSTFEDRLASLKEAGFAVELLGPGRGRVTRGGCGAIVEDAGGGKIKLSKVGVLMGSEVAMLISGGYQMFLRAPSGREAPALADHLKALHAFEEDLREAIGLTSLYNLSLGTTSDEHLYDRIQDRDRGEPKRAWEKKSA